MRSSLKSHIVLFFVAAVGILGAAVFMTYYALSLVAVTSRDYRSLSQDLYMLNELQLTVQQSLMPPNDYLIHPTTKQQGLFEKLSARADRLLEDLQALHSDRATTMGARSRQEHEEYLRRDNAALAQVKRDLVELRALARDILRMPVGAVARGEGVEKMERMDAMGEGITDRLQGLADYHLQEMQMAWDAQASANARAKTILLITVAVASLLALVLIWLVLSHATVLRQSMARRDQLNSLYEAGRQLTAMVEREELMPWLANTAAKLMHSEAAGFHLLDNGRLVVGSRSEGADGALFSEVPLDRASPWRKIINSNEYHISTDIAADPIWPEPLKATANKAGFQAFLGVPLRVKGEATGVLTVFRRNPGDFQAGEIEVLGAFADQAAVALENAELIESLKSTQSQLLQSEKMAGLGHFIAGMAHEVGTPLNIISGNAEYLQEVIGDKVDVQEELQVIIQQTERITRLIQQLLDFSRPQQAIVKEPLQVNDLINQVLGLIGLQAAKDGIEISTALQADMPPVVGSSDLLQQVFVNIGLNAFHAMPEGGRLTIITQTGSRELGLDAEPEWLEVLFRDTGVGIEHEDLNKIFDPFFSTKPSGEGTGLGLYLSYQIVNNHGGEIVVSSEPGKGTTVKLIFPIAPEGED